MPITNRSRRYDCPQPDQAIFHTVFVIDSIFDEETPILVKRTGKEFVNLVGSIFCHLPFSSTKQDHAVQNPPAKPSVSEEDWADRLNLLTD